jgi:acetyl esterase/lipase
MRLDPVFEPLRQIPAPDFDDLPAARRQMASMQALLAPRRSATVSFDDRTIDGPSGKLKIRVYDPQGGGRRGALLYLHGGGFVVGDLDSEHPQCIDHAEQAGCVVVSVDYRLAPEFPFPAAHDDAWTALSWLVANADELRVDPDRLAVGGGSAGATLAAGVALRARDEGSPSIRLALLVQPALDHLQTQPSARNFSDTPFLTKESLPLIWRAYFGATPPTGKALSYAAPAAAESLTGYPRVLLIVGDVDPLRDEGLAFAMRLIADGTEVELHLLAGAPHGFDLVEHAPVTQLMRVVQAAALARALSTNGDWSRRLIAAQSAVRFHGPLLWALAKRFVSWPARRAYASLVRGAK